MRTRGRFVRFLDRRPQRLTCGKAAVGLDGERDGDGNVGAPRGSDNTDGFRHVVHRNGTDHIGRCASERPDLFRVIGLGFIFRHHRRWDVAVTARSEAATDHDGHLLRFILVPNFFQQVDGRAGLASTSVADV